MRPYLAVIRDSFQAALANRVLWIAFLAIWVAIAALAPIGYREDFTTKFHDWDFDNGTQLKAMLAQGLADTAQESTALGRLSKAMPDDLKRQLKRVAKGDEVRIRRSRLADALNKAVEDESWYEAEAWRRTPRLKELRELDEQSDEELGPELIKRRARLRIEAALPGVFEARSARSILVTYAGFDFPAHLPFGKEQFNLIFNQFVLPFIMNWMLGFALIFLGVLVTASIVPDMLQPGSLHLLLSKPISRTMLLLSKFVGACAFVFLCVCQLVVGLWLIAGFRLDIWNARLLWCIPVVVFMFAVYYSVSFFAGLRWRTPILAIGLTVAFGAIVSVVGGIAGYFDGFVTEPQKIRSIALAGQDVIASTKGGAINRYDRDKNKWESVTEADPRQADLVLPVRSIDDDHVVTARIRGGRFNPYGSGSLDILVLEREGDWEPEPGLRLPIATRRLMLAADGALLAMNTGGLMQTNIDQVLQSVAPAKDEPLDADKTNEEENGKSNAAKPVVGNWLTDLLRMRGGATAEFKSVLPPGVAIVQPARVVVSDDGSWLIVYARGRVTRLTKPKASESATSGSSLWINEQQRDFEGDAAKGTVVAISGDQLFVARSDEKPEILNAETLETIAELELPSGVAFHSAVGLRDGKRFAAVTTNGNCRIIEVDDKKARLGASLGIGDVESIHLDKRTNTLLVANHVDRVEFLDAETLNRTRIIQPSLDGWRTVDKYLITPLRTLTPQTGELGQTVAALVGGKSSMILGQRGAEDGEVLRFKMVRPVASCAGFILFMLVCSCWYFSTRDF